MIESPEGSGLCPECVEQIVCFDEYDSNEEYICAECRFKVENHGDMYDGALLTIKSMRKNSINPIAFVFVS